MGCAGCGQKYIRPNNMQAAVNGGGASQGKTAKKTAVSTNEVEAAPTNPALDHPGRVGPRTGYNLTPYVPPVAEPEHSEEASSKKDD